MIIFVICRNFSKLQTVHGYLSVHRSFLSFQRSFTEFKTWSINVTESQFDISMAGSNRLHLRSWSSRDRAIFRPEYIYMCDERFSVAQPRWAVFDRHCTGSLTRRMGFVTTSSLWHWLRDASIMLPLQHLEFYLCFQLFATQIICSAVFLHCDSFRCDATRDVGHDLLVRDVFHIINFLLGFLLPEFLTEKMTFFVGGFSRKEKFMFTKVSF